MRTDFHGAANPRQVLIEKAVAARRRLHASFALPNLASALFVQRRRLVDRLARRDEKAALCSQAPAGDKRAIALHGMPTSRQATMRAASGVDGGRAAVGHRPWARAAAGRAQLARQQRAVVPMQIGSGD